MLLFVTKIGMVQNHAVLGNKRQYTIDARKAQDF